MAGMMFLAGTPEVADSDTGMCLIQEERVSTRNARERKSRALQLSIQVKYLAQRDADR